MSQANVLVIEDDAAFRALLEGFLRRVGYSVASAQDSWQGMARISTERPDLILLDFCLPIEDGRTFLSRMRHRAEISSIPVIFLSVIPVAELEQRIGRRPHTYFLQKGSLEALSRLIERLLRPAGRD